MKKKKEFLIGLLVIVSGLLLYWGVYFLKGMDVFSHQDVYYAQYEEVDGLMTTNPVLIKGVKVGQVKDVYFQEDSPSRVMVELMITEDIRIPANSLAKIVSSDLMGSKAVVIVPGDAKEYARPGDTLQSATEVSFQDAINRELQPIKLKAEKLMNDVDTVLSVIHLAISGKSGNNIAESLDRILKTIKYMEATSGAITELVEGEQRNFAKIVENLEAITTNFNDNQEKLNTIIDNFSAVSDSLAKAEIASTIHSLRNTIDKMDGILKEIEEGKGSLGLLLKDDSLYIELENSSRNLNLLLEDIRKNPKRYLHFSAF